MRKAFLYRAYPTRRQEEALIANLNSLRDLYNECLEIRKTTYESEGRTVGVYEQSKWYTQTRKENPVYGAQHRQHGQAVLRRLDRAYKSFFRRVALGLEKPGFPRFKGEYYFNSIELIQNGNGFHVDGNRLVVKNVGDIKFKMHRAYAGAVKTAVIKRRAGKWFVSLSCNLGDISVPDSILPTVAIVLGLDMIVTTSNNQKYEAPKPLWRSLDILRIKSQALSAKQKFGKNWCKAKNTLARLHAKIANQRNDHHQKLSTTLLSLYGTIIVEKAAVAELMMDDDVDSRDQADAAWSYLIHMLKYKASSTGATIVEIDKIPDAEVPEHANDHDRARLVLERFMQGRAGPAEPAG